MRYCLSLFVLGLTTLLSLAPCAESQSKKKSDLPLGSDRMDAFDDPLPAGAITRIGSTRYRLQNYGDPYALSPDGKWLARLSAQDGIQVWELPTWTKNQAFKVEKFNPYARDLFVFLAFTPDGKTLLTREFSRSEILVLDRSTGKTIKKITLPKHEPSLDQQVIVSADQQTLVFSGKHSETGRYEFLSLDLATNKTKHASSTLLERAVISPDCRRFAVSGHQVSEERNVIEFGDLTTGKTRLIPSDVQLQKLAFSPDGKWLAAAGPYPILRVYDVGAGKEQHNIRLRPASIDRLIFAPDGKSFYLIDGAAQITQWDPVKGERLATHKMPNACTVRQFAFLPQAKVLALGHQAGALLLWEVATGKVLSRSGGPIGPIREVRFSPQGDLFVADCERATWWNPRTGDKKKELAFESPGIQWTPDAIGLANGRPARAFLAPNAEFLASVDDKALLSMFDARTGVLLYQDSISQSWDGVFGFYDHGNKSSVYLNGAIRLWHTANGRDIVKHDIPLDNKLRSSGRGISHDGKYFAAISFKTEQTGFGQRDYGKLLLWDLERKAFVRDGPYEDQIFRMGIIAFSWDSRWLAMDVEGASAHRLQLTRIDQPKRDHAIKLANRGEVVSAMTFSPDGRQFAYALSRSWDSKQGEIFVCKMATKKIRLKLAGHASGAITQLAYAGDSGMLASGSTDTTALVWNAGLQAWSDKPAAKNVTADELASWFKQMASSDAKIAFQNMIKLAQAPKQAVNLLEQKIPPAPKLDLEGRTIAQWIQDLASGQFAIRGKASAMLQKIGPSVEPELRAALPKANDVETKRRMEELLEHLAAYEWSAEEVLHARAVEVLDAIGTPEARALLTRWTSGDPAAVLTVEARRALGEPKK